MLNDAIIIFYDAYHKLQGITTCSTIKYLFFEIVNGLINLRSSKKDVIGFVFVYGNGMDSVRKFQIAERQLESKIGNHPKHKHTPTGQYL